MAVWPIAMLFTIHLFLELSDRHVGPALLQEAGWSYVVQAYAAVVLCTLGPVGAVVWKLRRHRR